MILVTFRTSANQKHRIWSCNESRVMQPTTPSPWRRGRSWLQFNVQENSYIKYLLSATYMRQWIGSALVQIMACRLFGAKPLSKPMLGYSTKCIWKYRLRNGVHFVQPRWVKTDNGNSKTEHNNNVCLFYEIYVHQYQYDTNRGHGKCNLYGYMMTSSNGNIFRFWPFVRGIHRSPVNSSHKGQWRDAVMISLICVCINGWVNNREAGDLRRYRAHYDAAVMYNVGNKIMSAQSVFAHG